MSALHVLIVEDSLIYRRLLSRMLTQWGYIVSEAENGVAALEILASEPVSMVISDWGNARDGRAGSVQGDPWSRMGSLRLRHPVNGAREHGRFDAGFSCRGR